jgi:hypothetical protein
MGSCLLLQCRECPGNSKVVQQTARCKLSTVLARYADGCFQWCVHRRQYSHALVCFNASMLQCFAASGMYVCFTEKNNCVLWRIVRFSDVDVHRRVRIKVGNAALSRLQVRVQARAAWQCTPLYEVRFVSLQCLPRVPVTICIAAQLPLP